MKEKNILVTGGAGFIGSSLIDKLLLLGNKVVCIDNYDTFYERKIKIKNLTNACKYKDFHLVEGDITNKHELLKCFNILPIDLVIHLAAKAGVRPSIEDPEGYFNVNVIGTLNVLESMRNSGVKKLIFASSSSVYGNSKKTPFSESDIVDNPISPYAASKKASELLCHTYHHLFNFDIFCLRFFTVYGPRQRPDLAIHKFTDLILKNEKVPFFGDGTSKRDYTYIDDILDGILASCDRVSGYEIINLGESRTISLSQMLHLLGELLERKIDIQNYPFQSGDVNITYADISKAKKLLNYNPKWSFEAGLLEFIKWKRVIN